MERKKGKNANKEKEINLGNEFVSKFTEKTAGTIGENVGTLKKMGLFDLNTELFKFLDLSKIEVAFIRNLLKTKAFCRRFPRNRLNPVWHFSLTECIMTWILPMRFWRRIRSRRIQYCSL